MCECRSIEEARDLLAMAIAAAIAKSPMSSSFLTCGDLARHGGPSRLWAGKIGRGYIGSLNNCLSHRGLWVTHYAAGRFYVERATP